MEVLGGCACIVGLVVTALVMIGLSRDSHSRPDDDELDDLFVMYMIEEGLDHDE
jgi:hypothetical protein